MKFICPAEDLAKALAVSLRTVGSRAGIPALAGVLLQLEGDELTITSTDLELTTQTHLKVTGEAGKVLVPAKYLSDICRNLPSDEIEFVLEDTTVRIGGGRARYSLRTLPAEDLPLPGPTENAKSFSVDGALFSDGARKVVSAASSDPTRPVLTGVRMEGSESGLRLVATDSYRLALVDIETSVPSDLSLLVPARAVNEVSRVADGEINVEFNDNRIVFTTGNTTISSRLIDGDFPQYRKLLPENQPNRVTAKCSDFVERLRAVSVLAADNSPVFFELESDRIRLTCKAQGVGEAVEEVDATFEGSPMKVAFNPAYLEAGVSGVGEESFHMELTEPQKPVILRGDSDAYTYLLMPIRVAG